MIIASLLILGFVLRTIVGLRSSFTGLTAHSAWSWATAACVAAMISVGLRFFSDLPAGITTSIHYVAATLLLTPLMDILGARNPGHKAWPWFVIVPMLLVLQWPTISHLFSERLEIPLTVPLPATIGFLLVLIMGTGNYFGTANTAACLFSAAAILFFTLPVTEWSTWPGDLWCLIFSICLAVAALLIEGRLKTASSSAGHERLWTDFRDIYGMVWARRVMDRINQFSDREKWPVAMTLEGFRRRDSSQSAHEDLRRPEEILRWVLRRFADQDFLNQYLSPDRKGEDGDSPDQILTRPEDQEAK